MGIQEKRWSVIQPDDADVTKFMKAFDLSRPVAQVLCNRNIPFDEAESFLHPKLSDLRDPMELPDMEKAVARIWKAIQDNEKILVHGDFDADGITSTALLSWVLKNNGALVDSYLPNRIDDGYGLSPQSIAKGTDGHTLIITVDCGITSFDGANYAKENGIDIVITDHHQPEDELPDVLAIVNPKLIPENTHVQPLAGVGVCFKLCHAFLTHGRAHEYGGWKPELRHGIDLVALGTVADIVPLIGENRRLVHYGMRILSAQHRPGIHALCEISGIEQTLKTEDIAFRLAPRLNAAGRIGDAHDALDLLETQSIVESYSMAKKLGDYNRKRQEFEEVAYNAAIEMIRVKGLSKRNAIIVYGREWHRGVIGIVASRLAQEYNRPSFVLTLDDDGTLNGSGRSITGIDLVRVLDRCREYTIRFGGHPMAVGLALKEDRFTEFLDCFDRAVEEMHADIGDLLPEIALEGCLALDDLTDAFFEEVTLLQPFGHQNPKPAFQFSNLHCKRIFNAGKNNSRGVLFDSAGNSINFICFGRKPSEFPSGEWDVAGIPEINCFKGMSTPQIQIVDVRAASF
jgi:single-stranded-DNA-specific exonuclease